MVSGLDRSGSSRSSLRILPFSTVLFSGPFCSIVKNLPYEEGVRARYIGQLGKPRGKRSLFPYFSICNIAKSQRRVLMDPAWITVRTSWTSHYIQEDRVLFTDSILQGYWILSFSLTQIPRNVWKEQFPTVRDAKQTKTPVAYCNPAPSNSMPQFPHLR